MYSKRILILSQCEKLFAENGKELCGMAKLVTAGDKTEVNVFVTNARSVEGEWFFIMSFGEKLYVHRLKTFNDVFTISAQNLTNVSCILVYKQNKCYCVCRASCGNADTLRLVQSMEKLICESATFYERYLDDTENYYPAVDVSAWKQKANSRYKSVEDYSTAFERYYASGSDENYYQSVKNEIAKVFVAFPPYYPLSQKYKNSFFVRIDFPDSEKYFVLGVLQQNGVVKYICYGLPAEKHDISDKDFVLIDGGTAKFWMLFQDAVTGQITTLSENV